MDELNTTVCLSGIVLGSLMFQHFNSDGDSEGFILGESKAEERSNITDSQMDSVQYEHTIHIQKHIACHRASGFYDGTGGVKRDEMKHILGEREQETVIGWYRLRRNTEHRITFRERAVHQNLKRALSNHELVFLLLTSSDTSSARSTHRLEYSVFASLGSEYHNIPVLVSNLGMLEQQNYWRFSTSCSSTSYNQAVEKHRCKFFCNDGSIKEVIEVNRMNDSLQAELKKASEAVEESERTLQRLKSDIGALCKTIDKKRPQQAQQKEAECVPDDSPAENVLLCAALRALFPDSPTMRSGVLSLRGCLLPAFGCSTEHCVDIPATLPLILTHWDKQVRKRNPGAPVWLSGKRRRVGQQHEVDSEQVLTLSESDSEEELTGSQEENTGLSNSPVF